jgi:5-formyltetrahydrofolate cyclo-ligase
MAEHERRSTLAASVITRLPQFKSGARVALYLPFDRETDTAVLLVAARRRGICIYVPVVTDLRHRRIRFFPLSGRTRRGVFGIDIPRRHGRPTGSRWLDLIVVPLVGIDGAGRRLGMGFGFYDRAFAFRRTRSEWLGPRLVGLAFDHQCVDAPFADPWDLKLDALATESGLRRFPTHETSTA